MVFSPLRLVPGVGSFGPSFGVLPFFGFGYGGVGKGW